MTIKGSGLGPNKFIGKTAPTQRPAVDNPLGLDERSRARLEADQQLWDAAEALRLDNKRLFNERVDHIEASRQADQQARDAAVIEQLKADRRRAYLNVPGTTEAGFDREWPEMLRQWQLEQAAGGDRVEREAARLRASGAYRI